MQLTEFLDSVARGDVAAVAAALDAHPEWLDATGDNVCEMAYSFERVNGDHGQAGRSRIAPTSSCSCFSFHRAAAAGAGPLVVDSDDAAPRGGDSGRTALGRLLIDRGADVNATAGDNVTPLHLAGAADIGRSWVFRRQRRSQRSDINHDATPGEWATSRYPDLAGCLESLRPKTCNARSDSGSSRGVRACRASSSPPQPSRWPGFLGCHRVSQDSFRRVRVNWPRWKHAHGEAYGFAAYEPWRRASADRPAGRVAGRRHPVSPAPAYVETLSAFRRQCAQLDEAGITMSLPASAQSPLSLEVLPLLRPSFEVDHRSVAEVASLRGCGLLRR